MSRFNTSLGSMHNQVYKISVPFTKILIILVKRPRVVAKCCLNWICFHSVLYCYVKYSNIDYQDEFFKKYHLKNYSKGNGLLVLDIDFMALSILVFFFKKILFFIYFPYSLNSLRNLGYHYKTFLENINLVLTISTCTLLALSSRIWRFLLKLYLAT